jgi:magnesium transporter
MCLISLCFPHNRQRVIYCSSLKLQVRDELEQLLDDDDDMADLYLSRKLTGASSPVSGSGAANWLPASPTIGSKISKASRASVATFRGDENDVEELEMILEVIILFTSHFSCSI